MRDVRDVRVGKIRAPGHTGERHLVWALSQAWFLLRSDFSVQSGRDDWELARHSFVWTGDANNLHTCCHSSLLNRRWA